MVPQTSRDPMDLVEPWRTPSARWMWVQSPFETTAVVHAPAASSSETALDADLPELCYESEAAPENDVDTEEVADMEGESGQNTRADADPELGCRTLP